MIASNTLYGPSKQTGTQTCYMVCPICKSSGWNFYVNNDTGAYYCFADQHTSPHGGKITNGHFDKRGVKRKNVELPHKWKEIELEGTALSDECIKYLSQRGISRRLAKTLGIVGGCGKFSGRLLIPFFGKDMRVLFYSGRAYLQHATIHLNKPKYLHSRGTKPIYVPRVPSKQPLFLVEGPFDAIAFAQRGFQSAALCGQSITPAQLAMLVDEGPEEIIVCLDRGCELQAGALVNKLGMHFASVRMAQCPAKDPGAMTEKDFYGFFQTYLSK